LLLAALDSDTSAHMPAAEIRSKNLTFIPAANNGRRLSFA
jgi:hypothetical protein